MRNEGNGRKTRSYELWFLGRIIVAVDCYSASWPEYETWFVDVAWKGKLTELFYFKRWVAPD